MIEKPDLQRTKTSRITNIDCFIAKLISGNFISIGKKFLLVTILIVVLINCINAQEVHFSQYYNSPLILNPSETGNFEGDWRVAGNYRTQWRAIAEPYNTAAISYDQQFYLYEQNISGGLFFINDRSGSAGLNVNKLYLSSAYNTFYKDNQVRAGVQIGYVFKSLDYGKLTFPDQFDMTSGHFNSAIPTNEAGIGESLSYLDINMGFGWKRRIRKLEPEAGLAFFHINRPSESFYNEINRVPFRTIFHTKIKYDVMENVYIAPELFYMRQRRAEDFLVGFTTGMKVRGNITNVREVYTSAYIRNSHSGNSDAFVLIAGASVGLLDIAISYDINISPLNVVSNNRGAFEVSFIYKSISTVLNTFSIPCERF